jgi:hypothetical protein
MSKSSFEFLQPKTWLAPKGYSNGVAAEARQARSAGASAANW